jgi:hypothetical protein
VSLFNLFWSVEKHNANPANSGTIGLSLISSIYSFPDALILHVMINYRRLGHYPIFAPGATGAVTTIEYESSLISDLKGMLERIAPQNTRGMRTI